MKALKIAGIPALLVLCVLSASMRDLVCRC